MVHVYLTATQEYKFQKIQNACLRFSVCVSRREHVTPFIRHHKWLKMRRDGCVTSYAWSTLFCWIIRYLKAKLCFRVQCLNANLRFVSVALNIQSIAFFKCAFPRVLLCLSYNVFTSKLKMLLLCGQFMRSWYLSLSLLAILWTWLIVKLLII